MVGMVLSVVCAIHCLSVPFLMGVLPLLGFGFLADHGFEWVMVSVIFLVAGLSYVNGYRRHGKAAIFLFLAVGVLVFAGIRPFLTEELHPIATLFGGTVFVLGHWKNWHWHKASCRKACCSHD